MMIKKKVKIKVVLLLIALLATTPGCHKKRTVTPPDTFPVSGKVTLSSGKSPAGLLVTFLALDDPEKTATAITEMDGSFRLQMKYIGVKCEGAAAGTYRVRLERIDGEPVFLGQLSKPIEVSQAMTDLSLQF